MDCKTKNMLVKAVRYYFGAPKNAYISVIDKGNHYHVWYHDPYDRSDDRNEVHLSFKLDSLPRVTDFDDL